MDEKTELKKWLRELRGDLTQEELAGRLHVSSRTVMNAENPKMGFPNGLTMIRLLRELGAASAAPGPQNVTIADRLAALEARVEEQGKAATDSVDALARDLRALTRRLAGAGGTATQGGR